MTLSAATIPDLAELNRMIARYAPVELRADTSRLSPGDQKALAKLIEAAKVIDDIFLEQVWSGNKALRAKLATDTSPLGKARLHYFDLNKGPWSDLDEHAAFVAGVPEKKPLGANFYPEDMAKSDFEAWAKDDARGFFTVIRWGPVGIYRNSEGKRAEKRILTAVPYSVTYKDDLTRAANLLDQAAELTTSKSLQDFLRRRAKAFLSNDYYESDVAWMKLDAPIDVTIGPYETYLD